jgi:hypothetical protein
VDGTGLCSSLLFNQSYVFMLLLNSFGLVPYVLPSHCTDWTVGYLHKQLLGFYDFKSKKLQDEFSPEGMCRAAVFALHVKEELASWPEQSTRQRRWLTVPEAAEQSRHPWVQEALVTGFSVWFENWSNGVVCPDQSKR